MNNKVDNTKFKREEKLPTYFNDTYKKIFNNKNNSEIKNKIGSKKFRLKKMPLIKPIRIQNKSFGENYNKNNNNSKNKIDNKKLETKENLRINNLKNFIKLIKVINK